MLAYMQAIGKGGGTLKQSVKEFIESQYEKIDILHESDKSTIALVQNRNTDATFVLKRLKGNRDVYLKMKELSHPLLPKIIYSIVDSDETVVIEEYIKGKSVGAEPIQEKDILNIILQLCEVLSFLHKNGIIHRDIKPSNILLTEDKSIRLIDFDAARKEKNDSGYDTEFLGTRGYAAPEQYGFAQTSSRSDIYALGVTMRKLLNQTTKHEKYKKIIAKCTDLNPEKRYSSAREVSKALSAIIKRTTWKILTAISVCAVLMGAVTIIYFNPFMEKYIPAANTSYANSTAQTVPSVMESGSNNENTSASLSSETIKSAAPTVEESSEDGTTAKENVNKEDVLFYSDKMDYIFLDGNSISIEGKTAEMSVDLNGDGTKERFKISRDHPNGTQLMGYSGKGGMNFFYEDKWIKAVSGAFYDSGEIDEYYYAQISCSDLDNDGVKEVLVSVGDKASQQVTAVYSFTGNKDVPFEYKGYMWASDYVMLTSDFELVGPVGSAGLANIYKYSKSTLTQIQEG